MNLQHLIPSVVVLCYWYILGMPKFLGFEVLAKMSLVIECVCVCV